jgi:lipopolysaccharide export LptBFGC system permease protein LptF
MEQQSRWALVIVMALVALAGLTVIQQSHETKGFVTGLSMFVIAIGFVFYSIKAALGEQSQSGHGHSSHGHAGHGH